MMDLNKEYDELMACQRFEESMLDYGCLPDLCRQMDQLSQLTNSAVTIYDNCRRNHPFRSSNHAELFGYPKEKLSDVDNAFFDCRIHPDDWEHLMRSGIASLKHFFIDNRNGRYHKLIREYRMIVHGEWRRVCEQMQPLRFDPLGNIWLTLCVVDISPNQSAPFKAESKLQNFTTGDIITPIEDYFPKDQVLSKREIEILRLIKEGMMSKEIAESLCLSVHTINTHRQNILAKLKVDTSIEAIKYATALSYLD